MELVCSSYGPSTTVGSALTKVTGLLTLDQALAGTIGTWAMSGAIWLSGIFSLKVMVSPAALTDWSCCEIPVVSRAGFFFSRLNENSTSAAVTGVPFDQVTPLRRVKSTWVGLTIFRPVARYGM